MVSSFYIIWNKGGQSVQDNIGPGDSTERVLAKYALVRGELISLIRKDDAQNSMPPILILPFRLLSHMPG